jgi:hypothetical protein
VVPWDSIEKLYWSRRPHVDVVITHRVLKPDATKVYVPVVAFSTPTKREYRIRRGPLSSYFGPINKGSKGGAKSSRKAMVLFPFLAPLSMSLRKLLHQLQ